ncbi:MAG: hypothetical protein NC097_06620 [Clostridium sp.]|nr:hypothetical protein [Prevotella sp.]MCM1429453.1 hypothetical protein [Clostridium sp.]MCM1475512.1 hypothetical protein [Muribaculaceae bacterium]
MMKEHLSHLEADADGMATYEYIVNHVDSCLEDMPDLIDNLRRIDRSGQFLASSARFLCAIDRDKFAAYIEPLIEGAIEKDRERKYISSLLEAIWGKDYQQRVVELKAADDNFRRIYKRIYPSGYSNIPFGDIADE